MQLSLAPIADLHACQALCPRFWWQALLLLASNLSTSSIIQVTAPQARSGPQIKSDTWYNLFLKLHKQRSHTTARHSVPKHEKHPNLLQQTKAPSMSCHCKDWIFIYFFRKPKFYTIWQFLIGKDTIKSLKVCTIIHRSQL